MATIEEWHKGYRAATAKAGDRCVQLSFACIAIVWIFRQGGDDDAIVFPTSLLVALLSAAISLFCDLYQYIATAYIRKRHVREGERAGFEQTDEYPIDERILAIPEGFWYAKVGFLTVAYVALGFFLVPKLLWF